MSMDTLQLEKFNLCRLKFHNSEFPEIELKDACILYS